MNENKKENAFLHFLKANWEETLRPIAVLSAICLITSLLLGVTNQITNPIIKENAAKAADAARTELLPAANGFEKLELTGEGVTGVYKATNDAGYVITAEAKGYGGAVPAMVAFGPDGLIAQVKFLDNAETPGLGKKIMDEKFTAQFTGLGEEAVTLSSIDAIAGATISSKAAAGAVNAAVELYKKEVKKEEVIILTPEQIREKLLPDAGAITKMDVSIDGVTEAYKGEGYGMILYVEGVGFYKSPIPTAVAFDDSGMITGVWIDGSSETDGVGTQIGDEKFAAQFAGKTELSGIDAIAGATVSSKAATDAVQKAMDAYQKIKAG